MLSTNGDKSGADRVSHLSRARRCKPTFLTALPNNARIWDEGRLSSFCKHAARARPPPIKQERESEFEAAAAVKQYQPHNPYVHLPIGRAGKPPSMGNVWVDISPERERSKRSGCLPFVDANPSIERKKHCLRVGA